MSMTKEEFKTIIFGNKKPTADIRLLKMRLVYLFNTKMVELLGDVQS